MLRVLGVPNISTSASRLSKRVPRVPRLPKVPEFLTCDFTMSLSCVLTVVNSSMSC